MRLLPSYRLVSPGFWGLFVLGFLLVACNENMPENPEEYLSLINSPESGMTQQKTVNKVDLKLTYMPAKFLAWKEARQSGQNYKMMLDHYRSGMNFVLHIDAENSSRDIMGKGLTGFDEYNDRVMSLNFDVQQYVRLEIADALISPVLGTMENTYGLITGRKLIVVFPGDPEVLLHGHDYFDVVFDDPFFGTGVSRFRYKTSAILDAPTPQI